MVLLKTYRKNGKVYRLYWVAIRASLAIELALHAHINLMRLSVRPHPSDTGE